MNKQNSGAYTGVASNTIKEPMQITLPSLKKGVACTYPTFTPKPHPFKKTARKAK